MSYTVKSPLDDAARKTVGEALQGTLVDLIDLSLLAKQAHWNLIGRHFRTVHLQLDEVVATARTYTDSVAERLVAIGVPADGRAGTVTRETGLPQLGEGWLRDDAVVSDFVGILGAAVGRVRERIEEIETADPVSHDMLVQLAADLEKAHWMWQAENAS
jgi:starvation-inducible DNA-binding protein